VSWVDGQVEWCRLSSPYREATAAESWVDGQVEWCRLSSPYREATAAESWVDGQVEWCRLSLTRREGEQLALHFVDVTPLKEEMWRRS
jgi:hypothetical protein